MTFRPLLTALAVLLTLPVLPAAAVTLERAALTVSGDGAVLDVTLSQPVPWSAAVARRPDRLLLDVRADRAARAPTAGTADLIMGPLRDGVWRLSLALPDAMIIRGTAQRIDPQDGKATLRLQLRHMSVAAPAVRPPAPPLTIVLDAGHGGADRGAVHGGVEEADAVLGMAQELADLLAATEGLRVVLTRITDGFLPLDARVALAEAAGGDVLISLHADAVAAGQASGAAVFSLASDAAPSPGWVATAQPLAPVPQVEADRTATRQEDRIAASGAALARSLADAIGAAGLPLHAQPEQQADFAVLRSSRMPSVLVELGFLSDAGDRARLGDPAWRRFMALALREGLLDWADRR
jgi:N-acetylmuramoyl-L-alanine amidase